MAGRSAKHRPIYVRVAGYGNTNYWYVIEEKRTIESQLSSAKPVIGCDSDTDIVTRLPLPEAGMPKDNLAVINSRVYLIGGDLYTQKHSDGGSLGYRHLDLAVEKQWRSGGGKLVVNQPGGGVAVGPDGYVYHSVGHTIYRMDPGAGTCVQLPIPPGANKGFSYLVRVLGVTEEKLYVYIEEGRGNGANIMLSFDLKSSKWDVLDDNFWGDWSPGVVLYDDRYLISFGSRSPKLKPKPKSMTKRVQVEMSEEEMPEEEVPGVYVFDLKQHQWLPEPVKDLPGDGKVIPYSYQPASPEAKLYNTRRFSPQLFQINKDDDHSE